MTLPLYPFPHLLFRFFIDGRSICQDNNLMAIGFVERMSVSSCWW